ncbi:hypothetical protein [Acinetobacter baumannii]|uniref:hypothetical protein n=1 Tax=Acinetobacter baumannii TaxID=470 RepID=UPI0010583825|nr:hypothetical protein [Acinetobacter baumannii]QBM33876.1 hypothetical protein E1A89_09950 [Acinetobacter baumannii]QBM44568.1 hypothetical protein E1A87_11005 [Acinetobacter baumannii]
MTDLNKLRSEFEELPEVKQWIERLIYGDKSEVYIPIDETEENNSIATWINGAWFVWKLKAKAQAVPDTHVVVPRTREVVVAIEKMVEQQVEASGITSDVFRLDGWRILDAIQEASESGAEG